MSNGPLGYSSKRGLYSKGIEGTLFSQPVKAVIGGGDKTLIDVRGRIGAQALGNWLDFDLGKLVQGETDYQARVTFPGSGSGVRVNVDSNLSGFAIQLPEPLGKSKDRKEKLALQIDVDKASQITLKGNLGNNLLQSLLVLNRGAFLKGNLHFGSGQPALPKTGLVVSGHLKSLKLDPWEKWWKGYSASSDKPVNKSGNAPAAVSSTSATSVTGEAASFQAVRVQKLRIGQLSYGEAVLKNAVVGVVRNPSETQIRLETADIKATLGINDKSGPLKLKISELVLPASLIPSSSDDDAESPAPVVAKKEDKPFVDPLANLDPSSIPEIDVEIDSLLTGKEEFGYLKLQLRRAGDGIIAKNISGELGHAGVDGSIYWHYQNRVHRTEVDLKLDSKEVGSLMTSWGYPGLMMAKKLSAAGKVSWQGSPAGFDIDNLAGTTSFKITDGRFTSFDATSPTSALRLFGVLNLDSITRRLRLDFTDLFRSGIAFDKTKGVIGFDQGTITFTEPLTVKGPGSDFQLGGSLDVPARTMDMELVVTLPVTQNLPVISLLLGQPYIAGAAYVFDKLLGNSLDKFASIRYEIKGGFSDPSVQLDRLFSNKVENGKKTRNDTSVKP